MQLSLQHFWQIWSKKYLVELQQRLKWKYPFSNLTLVQMVLIKGHIVPSLQWKIARVIDIFLGPDNKCRVVKIKVSNGEFTRSILKLCPLPLDAYLL